MKFIMRNPKPPIKTRRINCFLGAVMTWLAITAPTLAQSQSTVQFLPTPPDQGAPNGRQRGGATRGDCVAYEDLTALVPEVKDVVWSQTASATPQFFFEVPAELTEEIPLEFVIQDSDDNYVFYQEFSMETAAGIVAVPTTTEAGGLALGESYSWTFAIYCDEDRPSASVSVKGTVQRVESEVADPRLMAPGVVLPAEEQFTLMQQYAAAGIWHEAMEIAIGLNSADPGNVTYREALESLLAQAGITETDPTEEAPTEVSPDSPTGETL